MLHISSFSTPIGTSVNEQRVHNPGLAATPGSKTNWALYPEISRQAGEHPRPQVLMRYRSDDGGRTVGALIGSDGRPELIRFALPIEDTLKSKLKAEPLVYQL